MVTQETAEEGIAILAERIALLYYSFVKTLMEDMGEEKTEELTRKVILTYGSMSGERTAEKVLAQGLPPTLENYGKGKDLPGIGWENAPFPISKGLPDGIAHKTTYCPFAKHWKELNFEKWGRLYCHVDQAKYAAYGKGYKCVHDKNILDGDDCCIIRLEYDSVGE